MRYLLLLTFFFIGCGAKVDISEIDPGDDFEVMAIADGKYDIKWTRTRVLSYDGNIHPVFERRKTITAEEFGKLRKMPSAVGDHYILHDGELLTYEEIPKGATIFVLPGP